MDVVIDNFEFLESKKDNKSESEYYGQASPKDVDPFENAFEEFGEQISVEDNFLE